MVQWLRIHVSSAEGAGSIPGWGTKIPHASRCWKKNKPLKNNWYTYISPISKAILPCFW